MAKVKRYGEVFLFGLFYLSVGTYWLIFNSQASWLLFLLMTLFLLINALLMVPSLKYLKVKPINLATTHVGQKQLVTIELANERRKKVFYPILIINSEILGVNQSFFSFYKKNVTFEVEWLPEDRKEIQEIQIEVESHDFFHFFRKKKVFVFEQSILVLPRMVPEDSQLFQQIQADFQKIPFGETSFNLEKIKPYQQGDSPKKIDWKLSSKQDQLMVREYESYDEKPVMLVFYGRNSKYFEPMLSLFFLLYKNVHLSEMTFYMVGTGVSNKKQIQTRDFSLIEPSEDPGELPLVTSEKMIILTPRPTKILDRELEKIPSRLSVQVITYSTLKGGGRSETA